MQPYDLSMLEQLDDRQQVLQILDLFLVNAPLQVSDLLKEAANKDWSKVYAHAHKLKGSLGIIQAYGLVELLQQIEKQAKNPEVDESILNGVLQTFTTAFAELETLLKEERNK